MSKSLQNLVRGRKKGQRGFLQCKGGHLRSMLGGGGGGWWGGGGGFVCPALWCGAFWSGPEAAMGRCGGEVLGLMGRSLRGWVDG